MKIKNLAAITSLVMLLGFSVSSIGLAQRNTMPGMAGDERSATAQERRAARGGEKRVPGFLADTMPRVSGLSVSVAETTPNGPGFDAELDITLTTTRTYRPTWSSFFPYYFLGAPSSALMGNNATQFSYGGTPAYGLTGSVVRLFYSVTSNTGTGADDLFTGVRFSNINSGTLHVYAFQTFLSAQLPIPAISYGDGDTQDQLTLTQASGTQIGTTTSGQRSLSRRWRASLTHSYPSADPYTVRVASGCCSPSVQTNTTLRGAGNVVPYTGTLNYTWQQVNSLFVGSASATQISGSANIPEFTNTNTTNSSVTGTGPFVAGGFVNGSNYGITSYTGTPLDQVTAMIEVAPASNILEIPTAGSLGLGALALMLASLGMALLRRSA